MVYVDVSQLIWVLARRKHCGGIHRVTLRSALGLADLLGNENVRLIVHFQQRFWSAPVQLLSGLASAGASGSDASGLPVAGGFAWQAAAFSKGDKLLLSEWVADTATILAFAGLKEHTGCVAYQFIHDMLPLAMPDYFFAHIVRNFRKNSSLALQSADVVLTISNYSAGDIRKYGGQSIGADVPIRVVRLTHEIGTTLVPGELPAEVRRPYVLMVGTLEGRKNTPRVIKAWRQLRKRYGAAMPQLVLVGNFSWVGMTRLRLMLRLGLERMLGGGVLHIQGCDDGQLQALYKNCLYSIYVSEYEGWGLPVGESLWLGRPVLAGNGTSIPEVGMDLVEYVDSSNQVELMNKIERLCFDRLALESLCSRLSQAKLRSWDDYSRDLASAMDLQLLGT